MNDHDRLLDSIHQQQRRVLADGCDACGHSKVFCRASLYLAQEACCTTCTGH